MNLSKLEFRQMQLAVMASPGEPVYARLVLRRLSFWLTPIAVSYTHLDVYKRQFLPYLGRIGNKMLTGEETEYCMRIWRRCV